jgi:hypothetical protein
MRDAALVLVLEKWQSGRVAKWQSGGVRRPLVAVGGDGGG